MMMAGSVSTLERIKKSNEIHSLNLLSSNKSPEGTESSVGDNESWDSVYKPTTQTITYESHPGLRKYVQSLKHLLPVRVKTGPGSYMPVDMTGCCAFTFFSWLTPLVWRTFRKGLNEEDLYHCSPFDSCQINGARFSTIWNRETKKNGLQNTSLCWTLFLFMRTRYIISCLSYIVCLACGFIGPTIFMRFLLEYIQRPNSEEIEIVTWMLGLLLSEIVRIVFFSFMWAINIRTAVRASSAVNALLYKKITRLRSLCSTSSGEAILSFSEGFNVPILIQCQSGGKPVTFNINGLRGVDVQFVLATLADRETQATPLSGSVLRTSVATTGRKESVAIHVTKSIDSLQDSNTKSKNNTNSNSIASAANNTKLFENVAQRLCLSDDESESIIGMAEDKLYQDFNDDIVPGSPPRKKFRSLFLGLFQSTCTSMAPDPDEVLVVNSDDELS